MTAFSNIEHFNFLKAQKTIVGDQRVRNVEVDDLGKMDEVVIFQINAAAQVKLLQRAKQIVTNQSISSERYVRNDCLWKTLFPPHFVANLDTVTIICYFLHCLQRSLVN